MGGERASTELESSRELARGGSLVQARVLWEVDRDVASLLRLVTATQLLGSQSPKVAVQIRFCPFRP